MCAAVAALSSRFESAVNLATPIAKYVRRRAMGQLARWLNGGRIEIAVSGIANVPQEGPVLLVARHYHHLYDGVALYQTLPRELHFLVTLDWAQSRWIRYCMEAVTRLAEWPVVLRPDALTSGADGVRPQKDSVFRESDIAAYQRRALRDAVQLLVDGKVLLIFPEGYPNIDPNYTPKKTRDEFLPFNAGFAVIAGAAAKALGRHIPIVPVGLSYVEGERWLAQVNFGRAFYAGDFPSRKQFVTRVEQEVQALSK